MVLPGVRRLVGRVVGCLILGEKRTSGDAISPLVFVCGWLEWTGGRKKQGGLWEVKDA